MQLSTSLYLRNLGLYFLPFYFQNRTLNLFLLHQVYWIYNIISYLYNQILIMKSQEFIEAFDVLLYLARLVQTYCFEVFWRRLASEWSKWLFLTQEKLPYSIWIRHFCTAHMWKHNKLFSSRQIGGRLKRIEQNPTIFFANVFGIFDVVISKIGPIRPRGTLGVPNPPRLGPSGLARGPDSPIAVTSPTTQ